MTDERVPVLFVMPGSWYYRMHGVDPYGKSRDAKTYSGDRAVVAHPPCRAWSCLRALAKPEPGEKELAPWAVEQVRENGGVLEHPAGSSLFLSHGIPLPPDSDEWGFTIQVDQYHWGHMARKRTWLYVCGLPIEDLPPIPHREGEPAYVIYTGKAAAERSRRMGKKHLPKKMRSYSPPAFAEWLVEIARRAEQAKARA